MNYAIMIGSDLFIGSSGILSVQTNTGFKEFFRVREIENAHSPDSLLVINCDIKTSGGTQDIKVVENRTVGDDHEVIITAKPSYIKVVAPSGRLILQADQLTLEDIDNPRQATMLAKSAINTILRIQGNFSVDGFELTIGPHQTLINTNMIFSGNISTGAGDIKLLREGRFAL